MQFDIIYAGTQARLNEQVEKRITEGWERRGDVIILEPDYSGSNIEVPKFVYFSQIVIKEN
jgi:hypothetical protein